MGPGTVESSAQESVQGLARQWGIALAADRAANLLRFASLLMHWNARINLTGARTVEALIAEHLPDSFALAAALSDPNDVVDVGSGGGLPALPLAVLRPGLRLTLVEPLAKKVAFLRTAVRELDLGGSVSVVSGRAESLAPGTYDVAVSRATLAPAAWVAMARGLVRAGGRIFVLTVPETDLPGRRTTYLEGRRTLIELTREECST